MTDGEWYLPPTVRYTEWVTTHEYAHQYFQGLLASDEHRWPVLDEGFAEYATGRAMEAWYGRGRELLDADGLRLDYWATEGGVAGFIDAPVAIASGVEAFPSYESYGHHVYRRAATMVHTAEAVASRHDVDRMLGEYARRARFTHPTPDTLLAIAREVSPDLHGFLSRTLFAPVDQEVSVDTMVVNARGASSYDARVTLRVHGSAAWPRSIEWRLDDGRVVHDWWDGAATTVTRTLPRRPISVSLDPPGRMSLEPYRLDDARRLDLSASRPRSSLGGMLFDWASTLTAALGP